MGVQGAVRGKHVITTLPGGQAERVPDRLDRNFVAVLGRGVHLREDLVGHRLRRVRRGYRVPPGLLAGRRPPSRGEVPLAGQDRIRLLFTAAEGAGGTGALPRSRRRPRARRPGGAPGPRCQLSRWRPGPGRSSAAPAGPDRQGRPQATHVGCVLRCGVSGQQARVFQRGGDFLAKDGEETGSMSRRRGQKSVRAMSSRIDGPWGDQPSPRRAVSPEAC